MKIITDQRCTEYSQPGHPERPERISRTVARLRAQEELPITWLDPLAVEEETLARAHFADHIKQVAVAKFFDGDTPAYPDINAHARRSVGGALHALALARKGETNFSLLRPPGHHATRDRAMGFCYFNSMATAVLEARATGAKRVAVFDFDVHHGNGTEAILHNQPGCAFFSIHQHPAYPGTGLKSFDNCYNYPVAPRTPRLEWRAVATKALAEMRRFKPEVVGVSAGFDAYKRDPLCQQQLEAEDYHWLGETMRKLGVPVFNVLEGGYSSDLPDLILAYLKGLEGK